jgi:hypothetical protein
MAAVSLRGADRAFNALLGTIIAPQARSASAENSPGFILKLVMPGLAPGIHV